MQPPSVQLAGRLALGFKSLISNLALKMWSSSGRRGPHRQPAWGKAVWKPVPAAQRDFQTSVLEHIVVKHMLQLFKQVFSLTDLFVQRISLCLCN